MSSIPPFANNMWIVGINVGIIFKKLFCCFCCCCCCCCCGCCCCCCCYCCCNCCCFNECIATFISYGYMECMCQGHENVKASTFPYMLKLPIFGSWLFGNGAGQKLMRVGSIDAEDGIKFPSFTISSCRL